MTTIETPRGAVIIRELHAIEEMAWAEQLQLQVWGQDITPHPKELLIPIQHEGGLVAGAFAPDGSMIGLVFGFPTKDPTIMHSQMLATLEDWRGHGIGVNLKWFQREWCLEHGYRLVRWTVDPLRAANAELNIRHLGGNATTYVIDYYGVMPGIDAGAPTDRLLIDWRLDSALVCSRAVNVPEDKGFPGAFACNAPEGGPVSEPNLHLEEARILVHLPGHYIRMSQNETELALAWRLQTREIFLHYFSMSYAITGFTRQGGPAYLLEKRDPLD